MNAIANYGAYQKNNYDNSVKERKDRETTRPERRGKAGSDDSQVKLSRGAKKLLEELRKTYSNMDFIVADYETEEEAQGYLSRGTKEYSVLIDPETLEKMAADGKVKEKYMGILEDATKKFSSFKEQLKEEGKEDTVIHFGVSIDKNGTVSYFAELEKMGEKQRERIEQAKEERAEEQEKNRKAGGKREDFIAPDTGKRIRVTANSMEELFDKILSVDWDAIKNESQQKSGGRFDFSI